MIVCVCNNISDRRIRQAVDDGMRSMAELRQNLELGTCCGKCHSCAKKVLRDCIDQTSMPLMIQSMVFQRNAVAA